MVGPERRWMKEADKSASRTAYPLEGERRVRARREMVGRQPEKAPGSKLRSLSFTWKLRGSHVAVDQESNICASQDLERGPWQWRGGHPVPPPETEVSFTDPHRNSVEGHPSVQRLRLCIPMQGPTGCN